MTTLRTRRRWWWLGGAIAAGLVASLAVLLLKPMLERAVVERIESAAVRHGMVARIGSVRVGVWPFLRLTSVELDLGYGARLHADMIAATYPGRVRLEVRAANLLGPAGFTVSSPSSAWYMAGIRGEDLQLTLIEPQAGLSIAKLKDSAGSGWNVEARGLDIGHLFDVRREGSPLLDGGIADGRVNLRTSADALSFRVDIGARGARFGTLADNDGGEPQLGDATDVTLRFDGVFQRVEGAIEIPEIHGTLAGADLSGSMTLREMDTDPSVDVALGVRQLEFGRLLGAAGLAVPESLGVAPGGSHDLGSATIEVRVRGRAAEPAALVVTQKINFSPPRPMPPAISRLRGDFVFRSNGGPTPHRPIDVSPSSPDFIALRDVPPLFVRTLLLAEDAGFYGHRGIDLRELPSALLTNWSRGGAARGASTITQQLAKNLFLSRDKEVGRKLQELAITFLLESELGKDRILEIYLNIIEWGPDLRGLRPAARHYFDCEPQALTPAQMAFLVAIIPGPIKYQRSFARGTPGPGLRLLIDNLLAKLRSVDAIGEEEYQRALSELIVVAGGRPPG
ncbi:MAG TPA: biosynthetic peptidoglycan transglycosylase [Steroidobacteraceae bacterium]|nr:biosynthetic peptidoglycan transglycosylase [Steroidobacteraceae bacterium]